MKKYILMAIGAVVVLAVILALVSSSIPFLQVGQAAAQQIPNYSRTGKDRKCNRSGFLRLIQAIDPIYRYKCI